MVEADSIPAVGKNLTAKNHVDQAISNSVNESSFLRLDLNEELELDEQNSVFPNFSLISPKTIIKTPTEAYVDSVSENHRNGRILSLLINDKDNKFDNKKSTTLDSITVSRNPI